MKKNTNLVDDEVRKALQRQKKNEASKKYHEKHKEEYREYYRQKYIRERDIYVARNARNYQERKLKKMQENSSTEDNIMV